MQLLLHAQSGALTLAWPDLGPVRVEGQRLRSACRCAACEHGRRRGQPPQAPAGTRLERISPIGEFGLQLHFSDGHERGIYPWAYLRELVQSSALTEAGQATEATA